MKLYKVTYSDPAGDTQVSKFAATHYSVSAQNAMLFFIRTPGEAKDELVGSIACAGGPVIVELDEKTAVLDGIVTDLSEELEEEVRKALGLDALPEDQKVQITVTLTS